MLNAKRHQRLGQRAIPILDISALMCSTPKGIKGWDRRRTPLPPFLFYVLNAKRHQRLGQSRFLQNCLNSSTCSTPKGIKGWDRRTGKIRCFAEEVLNAKRHQRLGQKSRVCSWSRKSSAQRQKASKVGTGQGTVREVEQFRCSTPKGIKGWDSSSRLRQNMPALSVLNAKRHQRLGQSPERFGKICPRCGAQRQKASKVGTG